MLKTAKRLGLLFLHPAVLVLLLLVLGCALVVASFLLESHSRISELSKVLGTAILGAGIFTAVTKAIVYGGIFRDTLREVLNESKDFGARSFGSRFSGAAVCVFEGKGSVESIDIFAHSSAKYLGTLKDHGIVPAKRVRLLVAGRSAVLGAEIPKSQVDRAQVWNEIEMTIKKWEALRSEGKIGTLDVRVLPFLPNIHFLIVDRSIGMFGAFSPTSSGTGVSAMNVISITSNHDTSLALMNDLQKMFDTYFDNYSAPWSESST